MVQPLRGLSIPREQKRLLVGGDTGGVVGGLWLVVMVINGWWLATGIADVGHGASNGSDTDVVAWPPAIQSLPTANHGPESHQPFRSNLATKERKVLMFNPVKCATRMHAPMPRCRWGSPAPANLFLSVSIWPRPTLTNFRSRA